MLAYGLEMHVYVARCIHIHALVHIRAYILHVANGMLQASENKGGESEKNKRLCDDDREGYAGFGSFRSRRSVG